jgi:hypothetical protein
MLSKVVQHMPPPLGAAGFVGSVRQGRQAGNQPFDVLVHGGPALFDRRGRKLELGRQLAVGESIQSGLKELAVNPTEREPDRIAVEHRGHASAAEVG